MFAFSVAWLNLNMYVFRLGPRVMSRVVTELSIFLVLSLWENPHVGIEQVRVFSNAGSLGWAKIDTHYVLGLSSFWCRIIHSMCDIWWCGARAKQMNTKFVASSWCGPSSPVL